jgi:hypothetical protein
MTDDYPVKYEFLLYDKLTNYFEKYSMMEQILDYCNTINKISFSTKQGGTAVAAEGTAAATEGPSKDEVTTVATEGPSEDVKEGGTAVEDMTDNTPMSKGGKRKHKSKKRKNRKRKYTRKV